MRIQRSLKHKKNKRIYIPFLILFSLQLLFLAAGLTGCGQTDETACEALFFSETVMKPAEKTETVTCRWASREAALLLQETWAKEYGSSLLFLVHDPLERTDVLRERVSGERIVMDSSQLAFLVNRFCERFLVCIP